MNSAMLEARVLCVLLGVLIAVTIINLWYWRRRRKMTPYERALEDARMHNSGDW